MENHKLDQLLTQGEQCFLLGAVREGERVFHPLKSLLVCGFPLGIQTSPPQPLVAGCCFQSRSPSRFLPLPHSAVAGAKCLSRWHFPRKGNFRSFKKVGVESTKKEIQQPVY